MTTTNTTLILTQDDVRALVAMDQVVAAVEAAFSAYGRGEALMPAKVYLQLDAHNGDFRAMPALMGGACGVKWVNSHPDNPARHGLPAVMGLYILSDPATARPLAVMDATLLTALRTGAAGAVASKYLAVSEPRTLGFIGCGVQARHLLAAHRVVYASAWRHLSLVMADANPAAAQAFADEASKSGVARATVGSIADAAGCDIACTTTPSRAPIIARAHVRAGTHINAMGADGPGKQELDPAILRDAVVVIDDEHQAHASGEVNVPLAAGAIAEGDIHGTLGEIVCGRIAGRTGDEITVFDSTGLAIQDVAVARVIHDRARQRGAGVEVRF